MYRKGGNRSCTSVIGDSLISLLPVRITKRGKKPGCRSAEESVHTSDCFIHAAVVEVRVSDALEIMPSLFHVLRRSDRDTLYLLSPIPSRFAHRSRYHLALRQ